MYLIVIKIKLQLNIYWRRFANHTVYWALKIYFEVLTIYGNKMVDPECNQYNDYGTSYDEQVGIFDENMTGLVTGNAPGLTAYPSCGNTFNYPWGATGGVACNGLGQSGQCLSYPTTGYTSNTHGGESSNMNPPMDYSAGMVNENQVSGPYMDPGIELSGHNYNIERPHPTGSYDQDPLGLPNSVSSLRSMATLNAYSSAPALGPDGLTYLAPGAHAAPGYPSPISHQQSPLQIQRHKPRLQVTRRHTDTKKRYRIVRGVSAGGYSTKPPKYRIDCNSLYLPVELLVKGALVNDICYPEWSSSESDDRRRIIRIERVQNGHKLLANFYIVGAANENPITLSSAPGTDVIEVSCLECTTVVGDRDDSGASDDDQDVFSPAGGSNGKFNQYYITSVEVIEIVELLIGTHAIDSADRRRERGRIRSNLVPFWSRKPISSRMRDNSPSQSPAHSTHDTALTNHDYRLELAKRIMAYEIRKPRGFDKEVRILRWEKLIPALKRALQTYYTEIPDTDSSIDFS